MNEPKCMCIRDLTANMRYINLQFIILEIGPPRRTRDGHDVRLIRIADQTGSVNLSAWDEIGSALSVGDICRLMNGYAGYHRGCLTVNCGKLGELRKIGEFCMLFSECPNMSLPNPAEAAKASTEGNPRRLPGHANYEENVDHSEPQSKQARLDPSNGMNTLASTSSMRNCNGGARLSSPMHNSQPFRLGVPRDPLAAMRNHAPQRFSTSYRGVAQVNNTNSAKLNRVQFANFPLRAPPPPIPANASAVVNARLPREWHKEAGTAARN